VPDVTCDSASSASANQLPAGCPQVDVILGVVLQNSSDLDTTAQLLQALLSNSSYAELLMSHDVVLASGEWPTHVSLVGQAVA
jgi:hypothetical protein